MATGSGGGHAHSRARACPGRMPPSTPTPSTGGYNLCVHPLVHAPRHTCLRLRSRLTPSTAHTALRACTLALCLARRNAGDLSLTTQVLTLRNGYTHPQTVCTPPLTQGQKFQALQLRFTHIPAHTESHLKNTFSHSNTLAHALAHEIKPIHTRVHLLCHAGMHTLTLSSTCLPYCLSSCAPAPQPMSILSSLLGVC